MMTVNHNIQRAYNNNCTVNINRFHTGSLHEISARRWETIQVSENSDMLIYVELYAFHTVISSYRQ